MQRIVQLSVLCLAAGLVSACSPDQVITTDPIPTAGVRFINAVPDSSGAFGMDFRFIDIVESNAQFRITFRNNPPSSGIQVSTSIEYKNARAGARHFRIFLDDTLQAVASTVIKDSTLTLEANHNYGVILMGAARSSGTDKMRILVIDETVADPGQQVALRVINATSAPIDGRLYAQGGTAPASATWASVPAYSASAYTTAAVGALMYNVRSAGGAANLFADLQAPPGTAASSSAGPAGKLDTDAIPGTTVAGSAVTMIVFPASTVGARTPQTTAFLSPAGTFMWDRRPPRAPGT
jgi:hypothetical protein